MSESKPHLPEVERARPPLMLLGFAVPLSLLFSVGGLFLFAWIAEETMEQRTMRFDLALRNWIHQFSSPAMTRAATLASFLGSDVLVAAFFISLFVFALLSWRRAAIWLTIAMAGALMLNLSLKYAFHRHRPTPFFVPCPIPTAFPAATPCSRFASMAYWQACLLIAFTPCPPGPASGSWRPFSSPPSACRGFTSGCTILLTFSLDIWLRQYGSAA